MKISNALPESRQLSKTFYNKQALTRIQWEESRRKSRGTQASNKSTRMTRLSSPSMISWFSSACLVTKRSSLAVASGTRAPKMPSHASLTTRTNAGTMRDSSTLSYSGASGSAISWILSSRRIRPKRSSGPSMKTSVRKRKKIWCTQMVMWNTALWRTKCHSYVVHSRAGAT